MIGKSRIFLHMYVEKILQSCVCLFHLSMEIATTLSSMGSNLNRLSES
uniref:Uncharacterized protein n=1 Tax=Brassica oleracea TaxID=3712 RepID=A0A3P6FS66_BRAOL|nr:unnamed protein product [Brassica oleracea]